MAEQQEAFEVTRGIRDALKAIYVPAAHEAIDAGDYDSHPDAQALARLVHQSQQEARIEGLREAEQERDKLRSVATDRLYMIEALVNMLGPVALKVWQQWQEKGVVRVHFNWGASALEMSGEERAQVILDFEAAPKEIIKDFDEHITQVEAANLIGDKS